MKVISTIGVLMQTALSQFSGTKKVGKMIAAVSVIKISRNDGGQALDGEEVLNLSVGTASIAQQLFAAVHVSPQDGDHPVGCLTSITSLLEDDAQECGTKVRFWLVLRPRYSGESCRDTGERCVHTSFTLGFLLTCV